MAKKYMGENDPALDALYEELGAIGTKTRADRKKRRQIERQIRKIRAGRLGGIKGLLRGLLQRNYPVPASATAAASTLGLGEALGGLEFDIGSRLGLGDAIEAQEAVPIEEIVVDATKRAPTMLATEPKFDISS